MTFNKEEVEMIIHEYVEYGILEIDSQNSDFEPSFRFTESHLKKIVDGDVSYIRYIEKRFNIECDNELVNIYKKMLKNYVRETKLN